MPKIEDTNRYDKNDYINEKLEQFNTDFNNIYKEIYDIKYDNNNYFEYYLQHLKVYLTLLQKCENHFEYKKKDPVKMSASYICGEFIGLIRNFLKDHFKYYDWDCSIMNNTATNLSIDNKKLEIINDIIEVCKECVFIILDKGNIYIQNVNNKKKLKIIRKVLDEIDKDTLKHLKKYWGEKDKDLLFLFDLPPNTKFI